tara:strand:- start:404 stop:1051 length:648 start_codon:yes stop_codon:yes gene_type:complete
MALTKVRGSLIDMADLDLSDVGALSVDSIAGDNDANTSITFSGSDVITIATGGSGRLTIGDGALSPVTTNQIDLGTGSLEFKDAYFDGTVTSDAFAGPLTGNVTGTASTATVATTVTITDNESTNETNAIIFTAGGDVDGGNLGLESDGNLTYNPSTGTLTATEVSATTLDIGGTNLSATAAELNYVDGVTSAIQTQMDTKASTGKAIAMAIVFG